MTGFFFLFYIQFRRALDQKRKNNVAGQNKTCTRKTPDPVTPVRRLRDCNTMDAANTLEPCADPETNE